MEFPLLYEGRAAGTVQVRRDAEDTCFTVCSRGLPPDPYRIVAQGIEGELLLGVMDSGALHRRFSAAVMASCGVVESVRAERCGAVNRRWRSPRSEEFAALPPLPPDALCRRQGRCRLLALPCAEDGPFPLPELFCFARMQTMEGRRWAVFAFDERGVPVVAEES